jgi:hypothetical protein
MQAGIRALVGTWSRFDFLAKVLWNITCYSECERTMHWPARKPPRSGAAIERVHALQTACAVGKGDCAQHAPSILTQAHAAMHACSKSGSRCKHASGHWLVLGPGFYFLAEVLWNITCYSECERTMHWPARKPSRSGAAIEPALALQTTCATGKGDCAQHAPSI